MPRQSSNWTRVIPSVGQFNRLAQIVNYGGQPELSPGNGLFRTGAYDRAGTPTVADQPALRGSDPTVQAPTVQPGANPYANPATAMQPRTAGSMWNTVRGGYTPAGSGYTGSPAIAPTNWTRDLSAPGGWVPRALPMGGGYGDFGVTHNNPIGFGIYPSGGLMTQKFR